MPVVLRSMAPCLFLIVMCSSVNNNNNNNHKRKKKDIILRKMESDTLDTDISFDVLVRRSAFFSVNEFDIPVRPMEAKGLIFHLSFFHDGAE